MTTDLRHHLTSIHAMDRSVGELGDQGQGVVAGALTDERQRRFFAGLESLKIGQGGDARIAHLLGVDPHTVAKGRRELLQRDIVVDGVRKRGGGRPSTEKKPRKSSPA